MAVHPDRGDKRSEFSALAESILCVCAFVAVFITGVLTGVAFSQDARNALTEHFRYTDDLIISKCRQFDKPAMVQRCYVIL